MSEALLIAAGGGGDAITAAAIGPLLGLTGHRPVVMTYAWDRLLIDPRPGPRSAADFTGLNEVAPGVREIISTTQPNAPAGSTLPRLADELPARLVLLDPSGGAVGMSRQVLAAAEHIGADRLAVVDVGGDAMTNGKDQGLRSPLADLLAIAAASLTEIPAQLMVPGPGIDGELTASVVVERIESLGGRKVATLNSAEVEAVASVFKWHPSEASGLFIRAAQGTRGLVEVRDAGSSVEITDATATIYSVDLQRVACASPTADLRPTSALTEAQAICARLTGVSEIDYESRKARSLDKATSHRATIDDLRRVDQYAEEASSRGAAYISVRRLAELIGIRNQEHLAHFRDVLDCHRATQYIPPVYRTGA